MFDVDAVIKEIETKVASTSSDFSPTFIVAGAMSIAGELLDPGDLHRLQQELIDISTAYGIDIVGVLRLKTLSSTGMDMKYDIVNIDTQAPRWLGE